MRTLNPTRPNVAHFASIDVSPGSAGVPRTSEPYAMMPSVVSRNPALSPAARALYVILDSHIGAQSSMRVNVSTLAAELGRSDRQTLRLLEQLRAAGLLDTQRTGRSLIFRLVNPSRQAKSKPAAQYVPQLQLQPQHTPAPKFDTAPQRIPADQAQADQHQAQPADDTGASAGRTQPSDAEYLQAIAAATGHTVNASPQVRQTLHSIRSQGLSSASVAQLTDAYLTMQTSPVRSPAGFLASFALPAIASGERAQPRTPAARVLTYLEQAKGQTECEHGEPRGAASCALCRRAQALVCA